MMNPIYAFELSHIVDDETATLSVSPNFKDDLSITWEKESQQEFFRRKLSGKLTFQGADCDYILAQPFGTKFTLKILVSYNNGLVYSNYWTGYFYLTDCDVDEDDKTCTVQPSASDEYVGLLEGMDKEYDIIPLAPVIEPIYMDKRPVVQVYRAGDTVMGCYLSGMWWEQECDMVDDNENDQYNELLTKYHFAKNISQITCVVTGYQGATLYPDVTGSYYGSSSQHVGLPTYTAYREDRMYRIEVTPHGGYTQTNAAIIRNSDNVVLWQTSTYNSNGVVPVKSGSGASGTAYITEHIKHVYCRILCDTPTINGTNTFERPADDISGENRNYKYIAPYSCPNNVISTDKLTTDPTEWGIYQPGRYYDKPDDIYDYYPISRTIWDRVSLWFADVDGTARTMDLTARKNFMLNNAYPLWSVIKVLLAQIAPDITHEPTAEYSQYLYGTNIILQRNFSLFLTPKSNVVKAQYDQPAQKAPITLKSIMDMLRDCFKCYCFVDSDNRFRIEHIRWFMKGGQYTGNPSVGVDLTQSYVSRNGLPWSYNTGKYSFDKPDMTGRYQFEWMDDCSLPFKGYPIDIISPYVNKERIETITVSNFSADVDYIMINPSAISLDGFVLLAAGYDNTLQGYSPGYEIFQIGNTNIYCQNGTVAFMFLQQNYFYDMPAKKFSINGIEDTAFGVARHKIQSVTFPAYYDIDTTQLVKTAIGNGQIAGATINLLSRQAKVNLQYDTE